MKYIKYLIVLACLMFINFGTTSATVTLKCNYNMCKNAACTDTYGMLTAYVVDNADVSFDTSLLDRVMVGYTDGFEEFKGDFVELAKASNTCPPIFPCLIDGGRYDIGVGDDYCDHDFTLQPIVEQNNSNGEEKKEEDICTRTIKKGNLTYKIRFFKDVKGDSKYTLSLPNGQTSSTSTPRNYVQFDGKNFYLTTNLYYESKSKCETTPIYLVTDDNLVYHIREEDLSQSESDKPFDSPQAPTAPTTTAAQTTNDGGKCLLGPNVTKDIAGVWKIIRILAPLLALALSILDAVLAVTKGDSAGSLKKVAIKFGKRVGYVVLLIFLNVILNAILNFALGIENGCDFEDNLVNNGTGSNESGSVSTASCSVLKPSDCYKRDDCETYQSNSTSQNGPSCRKKCGSMDMVECRSNNDRCTIKEQKCVAK